MREVNKSVYNYGGVKMIFFSKENTFMLKAAFLLFYETLICFLKENRFFYGRKTHFILKEKK